MSTEAPPVLSRILKDPEASNRTRKELQLLFLLENSTEAELRIYFNSNSKYPGPYSPWERWLPKRITCTQSLLQAASDNQELPINAQSDSFCRRYHHHSRMDDNIRTKIATLMMYMTVVEGVRRWA